MEKKLSYIVQLRNSLKEEFRHMPLFQDGSAIIVENKEQEILLEKRVDRDLWCLPGGLQNLGETFQEVATRELGEETGLLISVDKLILIDIMSGESRKNSYPNGDQVYNNTALFLCHFEDCDGTLNCDYEEFSNTMDSSRYESMKESSELRFFPRQALPQNLMDLDLIERYKVYCKMR